MLFFAFEPVVHGGCLFSAVLCNCKKERGRDIMDRKYFAVTAKCGHVGKRNYIPITYAIVANSKKEAAQIARYLPRVKHDYKDAIIEVEEIDRIKYSEINMSNNNDAYLSCKSIQEQRLLCPDLNERVCFYEQEDKDHEEERMLRLNYQKKKNKNAEFIEKVAGLFIDKVVEVW